MSTEGPTSPGGVPPRAARVGLVLTAAAALLLAGAGIAFACTGRAAIDYISPGSGKAGKVVTVGGSQWDDGGPGDDADVEIHWKNTEGQPLTTAQGPSFNVDVTIPDDALDGTHYLVAVAYDKVTGDREGRDSIDFEVRSGDPYASGEESEDPSRPRLNDPSTENSSGSNPEGSGSSDSSQDSEGSQNTTSSSSMSASGSNGPSSEESTSGSTSSSSPSQGSAASSSPSRGSTSEPSGARSSPSEGSAAASSPSEQPASESSGSPEVSESPEQVGAAEEGRHGQPSGRERQSVAQQPSAQQPSAQPEPRPEPAEVAPGPEAQQPAEQSAEAGQSSPGEAVDSEPAPEPAASEAAESEAAEPEGEPQTAQPDDNDLRAETAHPSARSGSGDLWSGFSAGDDAVSPGLNQPADVAGPQPGGSSQGLALAAGLAGAGLLVLMAGSLAALSRRWTLATSHTRRGA